jgi:hydrogenase-4 component B
VSLLVIALALIVLGAVAAAVFRGHERGERVHAALVVAGCALGAGHAVIVLVTGTGATLALRSWVPGGSWVIGVDPLSAVFLVAVFAVGAASVWYGTAYLAAERGHRPTWFVHAIVAVLIAALALVVSAQSIVPFLGAWEVMAIASYLLIVVEHEKAESRRAGLIYLVATHTGTLALFAMFAWWATRAQDWSFAALVAAAPRLAGDEAAILLLALIGFGFKAGLVPLHFWLPPAHASAPSHVSALLSGVVIKTGIYGLLRVVTMLGTPPAWFGWMVLLLGVASGVLGVLWALAQHDIKRLLAYHSVENIGIILMGLGTGALGAAYAHPVVAVIGYAGAVLHTVNHALFKSLLFLGAGMVYRATGTREMEALGGLSRALPRTWLAFLVGATAIIGVPPLNGFVSEWLVYQGMFRAGQADQVLRLASFGVPALALIGALALACFAKVSGVVFLGSPRSDHARGVHEPRGAMVTSMLALAGACVVLGVLAPAGVAPALRVAAFVGHAPAEVARQATRLVADATWIGAVSAGVFLLVAAGWLVRRLVMRRRAVRWGETWACGYVTPDARMQYTASSFAAPLLSTFGGMSGVRAHREGGRFSTEPFDLVLDRVATPLWRAIQRSALRLRPLQQGRLHAYLIYVMAALLVLLAYVAVEARWH